MSVVTSVAVASVLHTTCSEQRGEAHCAPLLSDRPLRKHQIHCVGGSDRRDNLTSCALSSPCILLALNIVGGRGERRGGEGSCSSRFRDDAHCDPQDQPLQNHLIHRTSWKEWSLNVIHDLRPFIPLALSTAE